MSLVMISYVDLGFSNPYHPLCILLKNEKWTLNELGFILVKGSPIRIPLPTTNIGSAHQRWFHEYFDTTNLRNSTQEQIKSLSFTNFFRRFGVSKFVKLHIWWAHQMTVTKSGLTSPKNVNSIEPEICNNRFWTTILRSKKSFTTFKKRSEFLDYQGFMSHAHRLGGRLFEFRSEI